MSEEEAAAAAEPVPEGKEPITLRVRDQVSAGENDMCIYAYMNVVLKLIHKRLFEIPRPGLARTAPAQPPHRRNQWSDEPQLWM